MSLPLSSRSHARRLAPLASLAFLLSACAAPMEDPTAESEQAIIPCASTIHYGDLTIAAAADTTAYRCVSEVRGNLKVTAAPETLHRDVDLSNLRVVYGDVSLAFAPLVETPTALRQVNLSKLVEIVGSPLEVALVGNEALGIRREQVPSAGSGSLDVVIDFGTTVTADTAFRLQALSAIDGSVAIEMKGQNPVVNPTTYQPVRITAGLAALATVRGDLRMTVTSTAYSPANDRLHVLLNRLQTVKGNVTFRPSAENQFGNAMPLTWIGGDLDVVVTGGPSGNYSSTPILDRVSTVGGAIRMQNIGVVATPNSTSRTFSLSDSPGLQWVRGYVAADEVRIERNAGLKYFELGARVLATGAIVIRDNPALSQCDVNDFIAWQRAAGWIGVATTSGNLATRDGKPCP